MPITYEAKGNGMHEAISAAGHWLHQVDGAWIASNDGAVQAIIDAYSIEHARVRKYAAVSMHAKNSRDLITASIAAGEMAAWPIKRAEAEQYASGSTADCPTLSAEALARGISLEALVAKVLANAARFVAAEVAIGGADGRHRDAIATLDSFEAIAAYDFSTGWPEA